MERMLDCQKISDYLKLNGWRPLTCSRKADLVIISTCAFGREEDQSSLDYIHFYLRRKHFRARLVVIGCLSSINPTQLAGLNDLPTLSPTTLSQIETIVPPSAVKFADVPEPNRILAKEVTHSIFLKKALWCWSAWRRTRGAFRVDRNTFKQAMTVVKTSLRYLPVMKAHINPFLSCNRNGFYYLRISKGCLGSCSYCAKKCSTGNLHSKPLRSIVDEFQAGLASGERSFYLLTEDVGCYGIDQQTNAVELLQGIFEAGRDHDFQIVISNFNARWFVKYYETLEPLLVNHAHKITYLQIPIQSGSTYILKRMDRHYSIEDVEAKLLRLRAAAPKIKLTTDIIVGFPGETEEDFELTKKFLTKIRFQYVDIFGYEKRPSTRAEALGEEIAPDVIQQRVFELACMQNHFVRTMPVAKKLLAVMRENLQRYRGKSSLRTP